MSWSGDAGTRRVSSARRSARPWSDGSADSALATNCPSVKTLRRAPGRSPRASARPVGRLGSQHEVCLVDHLTGGGRLRKPSTSVPHRANSASIVSLTGRRVEAVGAGTADHRRGRRGRPAGAPGARGTASGRCSPYRRTAPAAAGLESASTERSARPTRRSFSRPTKRRRRPTKTRSARRRGAVCSTDEGEVTDPKGDEAGLGEGVEHLVEAVLDGAAGGVDADGGVLRLLVRRGDAGELGDLAAPAPWRRGPCGRGARTPPAASRRGPGRTRRRRPRPSRAPVCGSRRTARSGSRSRCRGGGRSRRRPSRSGGCWSRGPPWRRSGPADRFRRTTSPSRLVTVRSPLLEDQVVQRPGQRGLAAAGEAGEEHHEPLLGPGPGGPGRRSRRPRRGTRPRRRPARARRRSRTPPRPAPRASWSASASPCEGSGTATTAASGSRRGRGQRGPDAGRRARALGRAGAVQREEHDAAPARPASSSSAVGERVARPGRACAPSYRSRDLRRREEQPPERAVLRVRQRVDAVRPGATPRPAAGPRGRPARPRRRAAEVRRGSVRVTGRPTRRTVLGASAPQGSSSRSSSSAGVGQCCGAGTGAIVPATAYAWPDALPRRAAPSSSPRSSAPGSWRATTTAPWWCSTATARCALVGRRRGDADAAALVQQAGPGAGHAPGRSRPDRASCWRWPAPPTRVSPSTSTGVRRILALGRPRRGALQTPPDYPLDDEAREALIRGRRRQVADRDELLRQARGDARDLRRQRLADRRPTSTPTTRCSRPSPTTFADLTGEPVDVGRGRRLRRPAALDLADRAGARVRPLAAGDRRARSAGSPTPSGPTRSTSPAPIATSSPCSARSPARSARPAPSPATRSRCRTAGRSRSRPTTAQPRARPVLMARRSSSGSASRRRRAWTRDAVRRTGASSCSAAASSG